MKLTKIHIERFCGIRRLEISVSNSLQILAGPNNSCKSTVLKAIHYFFRGFEDIAHSEYAPQNEYYTGEGNRSLTKVKLHFSELTQDEQVIFANAWLPRNREIWVEARITKGGNINYLASNDADGHGTYESLAEIFDVIYVPAVRAGTADVRDVETRKLFVAAKSVLTRKRRGRLNGFQRDFSTSAEGVTSVLNTLLEESRNAISDSLPTETDIEFQFPPTDDILDLLLSRTTIGTRTGTQLTVEDEGTGYQSLLSLGLLRYVVSINTNRNVLLLVEEPEAFLHPQFQRSVAYYLRQLSENSQLLVTSHSSVIVDSVNIENIARLVRQQDGLEYTWKWTDNELRDAEYLSRYCDAKNSEVVFADKVVLCEGITDHNVLTYLFDEILVQTHHHSNISIINGDGTAITHVAKLLDWFSIEHIIILDKDVYSGNDRSTINRICREKRMPLTNHDFGILDAVKDQRCNNIRSSADARNRVNLIMEGRGIYILGADIEAAVVHSYTKRRIIDAFGSQGISYFDNAVIDELEQLNGIEFVNRVNTLLGSKGWNTEHANNDNKPKPHILQNFIRNVGLDHYRDNSDIYALLERLNNFVA